MARNSISAAAPTTAQSLGALLKSARDIMRKDKGLNGDLDRLPMLTWIMFLKFLDDLEIQREGEAKLAAKKFKPAIEPPYRWRDWAAQSDGITGDELLAFINNEETTLPNSLRRATTRGAGLFRYLRTLTSSNGDNRRDVIATVFRGVQNRMVSGYLLRDVINKLNGIHFTASDELHTLGALYESMLREMRDAAGDSGEFYTSIPTNLLFFDRSGPTREVWYYEHPLPEGRKNYTKTAPIQFEEFAPLISWWNNREESERAWKVPAAELLEYSADGSLQAVNLDRKNPRAKEDITHLPPGQLAADILKKEQRIAEIMESIQRLLKKAE
jgi:type I restriction-modification system DNA methylase subunit